VDDDDDDDDEFTFSAISNISRIFSSSCLESANSDCMAAASALPWDDVCNHDNHSVVTVMKQWLTQCSEETTHATHFCLFSLRFQS